jgi:hypothetical protein
MTRIFLALLFLMFGAACTKETLREPADLPSVLSDSSEGRLYIKALVETVQKSDRIVITEHSNVDDILDPETQPQRPAGYIPITYATHELSASERAKFLTSLNSIATKTQDAEPACIFEPHHTITFYRGKRKTSAMRICFQCGQVEWDGSRKTRPWSLIPALKNLVSGTGMEVERDWYTLARGTSK